MVCQWFFRQLAEAAWGVFPDFLSYPGKKQGETGTFPVSPRKWKDVNFYAFHSPSGYPYGFVAPITPGRILFEAEGVSLEVAKEAMRLAANKLPVATKFVVRRDYVE